MGHSWLRYFFSCHFFRTRRLHSDVSANFVILIPKTDYALSIDEYRPIVLGNFFV